MSNIYISNKTYKYSSTFPRIVIPFYDPLFHIPHTVPLIKANQRKNILIVATGSQIHTVSNYKLIVVTIQWKYIISS